MLMGTPASQDAAALSDAVEAGARASVAADGDDDGDELLSEQSTQPAHALRAVEMRMSMLSENSAIFLPLTEPHAPAPAGADSAAAEEGVRATYRL